MSRRTKSRADPTPATTAGNLVKAIDALLDYRTAKQRCVLSSEDFDKLERLDGAVFALATAANLVPLPAIPHEHNPRVRRLGYTGVRYCLWQRRDASNHYHLEPRLCPDAQWDADMRSLRAAACTLARHEQPQGGSAKRKPTPDGGDRKQQARDRWLYHQCCKGRAMPLGNIVAELKRA
jgi:hypothetical protein